MAKEMTNGDTTEAQPATGQETIADDQLAIDPNEVGETQGQPAEDPTANAEEPMIPKSRLDEEIARANEAEANAAQLQQNMLFTQSQQNLTPPAPAQPPVNPYEGLEDDDYTTVGAAKAREKALAEEIRADARRDRAVENFPLQNPDYREAVGKANPLTGAFEMSQHLTNAAAKNPFMAQKLQEAFQAGDALTTMQIAYQLGHSEMVATAKTTPKETAQHVAANALNTATAQTATMPGSAVGGSGEINHEAATENMSDSEFAALDAKIMSGQLG